MLPPSYLESLPVGIVNQYAELESWIIADIARRISGADFVMTPTAEWQIKKAQMLRMSYDDVVKQVAKTLGKTQKDVRQLFREAGIKSLERDSKIYNLAGKDTSDFMRSKALTRTLQAGITTTNGLMKNFTRTMAGQSNKLFEDLLDQAYFEVQSGAFSYQTAIRKAIKQLGKQGIQTVKYPSGHTDQVDVAVRRAIITGLNKTSAQLQIELANEMDCDLVEVTSHFGARPSHREWQGGIYSISGKSKKYRSLAEATGYGRADGLCGINCRHNFYPFFEWLDNPLGNSHDAKESDEFYERIQKQRAYERKIRKQKREAFALQAAMSATTDEELGVLFKQDLDSQKTKLKRIQSDLDNLCRENGLCRREEREICCNKAIGKVCSSANGRITSPVAPKLNGKNQYVKQLNQMADLTMKKAHAKGVECVSIIDKTTGLSMYNVGTLNKAGFNAEMHNLANSAKDNSIIMMHNHPHGGSPTVTDIYNFGLYSSIDESIILLGNKKALKYIWNGPRVNYIDMINDANELAKSYVKQYKKQVAAGKLTPKQANEEIEIKVARDLIKKYNIRKVRLG